MKQFVLLLAATALLSAEGRVQAEEPVSAFVRGLVAKGYYDTAEEYLDRVEKDPSIPADVKKTIPYERAMAISASAKSQRNIDLQYRLLDRAAEHLNEFIKKNPGHPLLGKAQSDRGKILLNKARATTLEAHSPANAARRKELQEQALRFVEQARKIYTAARTAYKAAYDKFPKYIPKEQKQPYAAREKAQTDLIRVLIDLAMTTYEEAQIYKSDLKKPDPRYMQLLKRSAREFENIYTPHRTYIGGLYAQLWQGKCLQEQGQIGSALGIFNTLLDHKSTHAFYINIFRPQALSFKLICLNHELRKDYLIVQDTAEEWLKQNRRLHGTEAGLRIRFELARAREQIGLGTNEKIKIGPKDRPRYFRLALDDARFVNRYAGQFKDVSTLMITRLQRQLGLATEDPKDFPNAFSVANVSYTRFTAANDALKKARQAGKSDKEIAELRSKLKVEMLETARLFRLALKLAKPEHNQDHVNLARQYLAYVLLKQQNEFDQADLAYDVAVLAEFVARHYKNQDPDNARRSAYLALAAYLSLHNKAPVGKRQTEMRWIIEIARHINSSWPGSEQAMDASFILGNIYNQQERYLLAARWYARVPPSAPRYAESLLNAGTNYWGHYHESARIRPGAENYRREITAAAENNVAEAIAALLNAGWNEWNRVKRLDEVAQLLAAPADSDGKKPLKISKAAQGQIAALQAQSKTELLKVLRTLFKTSDGMLKDRPESELRTLLFTELDRKSDAELRKMLAERLAAMKEDQLKAVFQHRMEDWRSLAAWHLAKGVLVRQKQLPANAKTPEELALAKLALAEYAIAISDYKRAASLLTEKPHDVLTAIQPGLKKRRDGLFSRELASEIYQTLAQAYIGSRELDKFREAMGELEKLVAGGSVEEITRIYEKLGRNLQRKIERLQNQNDATRLKEERDNFKWVVNALNERIDKLDYNTLAWIGQTSFAMGEGLGDPAEAKPFFEDAAKAFGQALTKPQLAKGDQRLAVQLRLIKCLRRQQEFEKALALSKEVLKLKPRLLPAQIEAAYTLQDWARNKDPEKYLDAIVGSKDDNIWGWQTIGIELKHVAEKLHEEIGGARTEAERKAAVAAYDEMFQKYLEARYIAFLCRAAHGGAQNDTARKNLSYTNAQREILAFAATVGYVKDDLKFGVPIERQRDGKTVLKIERVDVKGAFDQLYADVQRSLGTQVSELRKLEWAKKPVPRPKVAANNGAKKKVPAGTKIAKTETQPQVKDEEPKKTESSALGMIFGVLFLLAGLGGGGWFLFKSMGRDKGGRRRMAYAYGSETPAFDGAASQSEPTFGSPPPKQRGGEPQRRKAPAGSSGQKRPAGTAPAKQRPKTPPPKST